MVAAALKIKQVTPWRWLSQLSATLRKLSKLYKTSTTARGEWAQRGEWSEMTACWRKLSWGERETDAKRENKCSTNHTLVTITVAAVHNIWWFPNTLPAPQLCLLGKQGWMHRNTLHSASCICFYMSVCLEYWATLGNGAETVPNMHERLDTSETFLLHLH